MRQILTRTCASKTSPYWKTTRQQESSFFCPRLTFLLPPTQLNASGLHYIISIYTVTVTVIGSAKQLSNPQGSQRLMGEYILQYILRMI